MSLVLDTPKSGPCTREEAFAKGLIPESTRSYQAVGNEELVLMLNDSARQHGLVLTGEHLGMDLKGNRLFGTYEIEGNDFFDGNVKLMMGFCNSYNKSLRIRVCFGAKVFVCSNLCFSYWTDEETGIGGEASHRHTTNVNDGLWQRLKEALSGVDKYQAMQEKFYTALADRPLGQQEAYSLIVQAGKEGIVNKARVIDIANEWDRQAIDPENEAEAKDWHPEFKGRNAFCFLQAFTQDEKRRLERNPVASNIGTLGLTNFFYRNFVTSTL
jgi:hypothetical protein